MGGTEWSKVNKDLLVKLLENWSFQVTLNANDTFYYASADATSVDSTDLGKLLEVYEKFGDDGVLAFQAKLRKEQVLRQLQTDKYHEALAFLSDWIPYEDQPLVKDDEDECLCGDRCLCRTP